MKTQLGFPSPKRIEEETTKTEEARGESWRTCRLVGTKNRWFSETIKKSEPPERKSKEERRTNLVIKGGLDGNENPPRVEKKYHREGGEKRREHGKRPLKKRLQKTERMLRNEGREGEKEGLSRDYRRQKKLVKSKEPPPPSGRG